MPTFRTASVLIGLLLCACGAASNPQHAEVTVTHDAVLVAFTEAPPTVTLMKLDGSVVATVPGSGINDERAVGAFLVVAADGSGKEWTVDASGAIKPVAPEAARLLQPQTAGNPLILDASTAIVGCVMSANGDCTAEEINLDTGAVRSLLTAPSTGPAEMALGRSLMVLGASSDLRTVWLRRITGASTGNGHGPTGQLEIVGVERRTGQVTNRALPGALLNERDLMVSADGKLAAGQEEAGTNSNHLAIRHLHLVALATGADSDMQGAAPYLGGQRSPSILFAPGGATVAWWGGVDNGDSEWRINLTTVGGPVKTVPSNTNAGRMSFVSWIDRNTLLVQQASTTFTIDATSGGVKTMPASIPYLLTVLG